MAIAPAPQQLPHRGVERTPGHLDRWGFTELIIGLGALGTAVYIAPKFVDWILPARPKIDPPTAGDVPRPPGPTRAPNATSTAEATEALTSTPAATEPPRPTVTPEYTATATKEVSPNLQKNLKNWVDGKTKIPDEEKFTSRSGIVPLGVWGTQKVRREEAARYISGVLLGAQEDENGQVTGFIGFEKKNGNRYYLPFDFDKAGDPESAFLLIELQKKTQEGRNDNREGKITTDDFLKMLPHIEGSIITLGLLMGYDKVGIPEEQGSRINTPFFTSGLNAPSLEQEFIGQFDVAYVTLKYVYDLTMGKESRPIGKHDRLPRPINLMFGKDDLTIVQDNIFWFD